MNNIPNQEEPKTLGFLGSDFQYKLCKCFIEYPEFFNSLKAVITPKVFTVPIVKTIVNEMCNYADEYNSVADYTQIKMMLNVKFTIPKDRDIVDKEVSKIQNEIDLKDQEWVKTQGVNFFKQQALVYAMHKAGDIVSNGQYNDYPAIEKIFNDALNSVRMTEHRGQRVFDNIDEIMSASQRKPVPTGIKEIDIRTNGGIGRGELGLICGPSGFGKTTISCALSSYAATCKRPNGETGYNVLYIFFEDTYLQIKRKFMGRELNVEASKLTQYYASVGRSREDMAYLDYRMKAINKNVWLCKLRDGEMTASEIEDMIKTDYIDQGFIPDLVIIDYFECIAPEKGTLNMGQHERELCTMRKIEGMCSALNVGLWVTTQGTKDSAAASMITADKISGSSSKFNVSHICMAIMKDEEDRANGTAKIVFLKNRAGGCGAVITNVKFDNGTCRISTEGSEVLGFEEYRQREEERQIKMRSYLGSLQYMASQITDDIPQSNDLQFFGGASGDDSVPF